MVFLAKASQLYQTVPTLHFGHFPQGHKAQGLSVSDMSVDFENISFISMRA